MLGKLSNNSVCTNLKDGILKCQNSKYTSENTKTSVEYYLKFDKDLDKYFLEQRIFAKQYCYTGEKLNKGELKTVGFDLRPHQISTVIFFDFSLILYGGEKLSFVDGELIT